MDDVVADGAAAGTGRIDEPASGLGAQHVGEGHGADRAQFAAGEAALGLPNRGGVPYGVGGGQGDAMFGATTDHRRGLGQRNGQGLLAQDVFPGLGGGQGEVVMGGVGGADADGVYVLGPEDVGVVGVDANRVAGVVLVQHTLGESALFGVGVRHRDQFNFGQPQHGAQVRELMPVVEADRGDANGGAHTVTADSDSQARTRAA